MKRSETVWIPGDDAHQIFSPATSMDEALRDLAMCLWAGVGQTQEAAKKRWGVAGGPPVAVKVTLEMS